MRHYYNEWEPYCAEWLRNLIAAGLIPKGDVDESDIRTIKAADLKGYTSCHFFAGLGGWAYALRLAGWPDERPVWTGSCPCQPFSCAGAGKGEADERHLWPEFRRLIGECRPAVCFGEQVASAAGRGWLAGVRADLEALAYAVGCADLCAASVGAPMVSQRLHWVATSNRDGFAPRRLPVRQGQSLQAAAVAEGIGKNIIGMAPPNGCHEHWWSGPLQVGWNAIEGEVTRGGRKYRAQWRIKPGLSLLADGIPGRVHLLRGYGNAIVPQLAAEFVKAYLETGAKGFR